MLLPSAFSKRASPWDLDCWLLERSTGNGEQLNS